MGIESIGTHDVSHCQEVQLLVSSAARDMNWDQNWPKKQHANHADDSQDTKET